MNLFLGCGFRLPSPDIALFCDREFNVRDRLLNVDALKEKIEGDAHLEGTGGDYISIL